MGVTNLTPIKWPTVLVDEVQGKPCNSEACLCGALYSTFNTTYFYPYVFHIKRFVSKIQCNVFLLEWWIYIHPILGSNRVSVCVYLSFHNVSLILGGSVFLYNSNLVLIALW